VASTLDGPRFLHCLGPLGVEFQLTVININENIESRINVA
jgi:hypothetical protein